MKIGKNNGTLVVGSLLLLLGLLPMQASALMYSEVDTPSGALNSFGDFPGAASFTFGSVSVGVLDIGSNIVTGALDGICLEGGCNDFNADTQDSFVIELAAGQQLDSLYVTVSNFSGPAGFVAGFGILAPLGPLGDFEYIDILDLPSLPLGGTTGDLLALSLVGPNLYSVSLWGRETSADGPYSFDYSIEFNTSAVPLPAAAWLFGSAILGLAATKRRKSVASQAV